MAIFKLGLNIDDAPVLLNASNAFLIDLDGQGHVFVEPAGDERDMVVIISVRCMCVRACGFVQAITSTFMHGFQKKNNNMAQLLSLTRSVF